MVVSMQNSPTVLTAAGRRALQGRLDRALAALAALAERMSAGERGPEEVAQHQQLLTQVEELTSVLNRASDVASVDEDPSIVELGDEVDVEMPDGSVDEYVLVDPVEASADEGRISIASPLGRALLGARPGDRVTVSAPAGDYGCMVVSRRRSS
jgi:transcription elongation GreA/GreB family factor